MQQILPLASLGQDDREIRSFGCAQDDRLPVRTTSNFAQDDKRRRGAAEGGQKA